MDVTRRNLLKISGAATAGLMLGSLFDLRPIKAYAKANPPENVNIKKGEVNMPDIVRKTMKVTFIRDPFGKVVDVDVTGETGTGKVGELKIKMGKTEYTIDTIPEHTIIATKSTSPGCYWYFWAGKYWYVCG